MSDIAPIGQATMPGGALPSALDHLFPPEKPRVDAQASSITQKHEFELEDRRHTDWRRRRAAVIDNFLLLGLFFLIKDAVKGFFGAGLPAIALWLTYFFAPSVQVSGHRTSNPYLARVDKVCERRVNAEWGLGLSETSRDATILWVTELGAIDSMPKAPSSARHDMRAVRGMVEDLLHY